MSVELDSSVELIADNLPIERFLNALESNNDLWKQNTWRQTKAGGQQDTESVMFRWAEENNFESIRDSISVVNTKNVLDVPECHKVFSDVLSKVEAETWGRAFVVKLKPGGRVYPHADVGVYADTFERFHLCLKSEPEFEYSVQHPVGPVQTVNMKAGELWWFNHKRVHWAYNAGKTDRISLIIDAVSPKWKRERDQLAIGVGYVSNPKEIIHAPI